MIKRNYSHALLNLATFLFQSFGLSLLILSCPLPLPFLISFPNFEIKSDLWEVMGCKGVFPRSEKQTRLSVPCKSGTEDLTHFLLKCSALKDEWEFFWESLFSKVEICCLHQAGTFKIFSVNLINHNAGFS